MQRFDEKLFLLQQLIDSICLFLTEIKSSLHFNKKGFGDAEIEKRFDRSAGNGFAQISKG